jgi:hypothetical protein
MAMDVSGVLLERTIVKKSRCELVVSSRKFLTMDGVGSFHLDMNCCG